MSAGSFVGGGLTLIPDNITLFLASLAKLRAFGTEVYARATAPDLVQHLPNPEPVAEKLHAEIVIPDWAKLSPLLAEMFAAPWDDVYEARVAQDDDTHEKEEALDQVDALSNASASGILLEGVGLGSRGEQRAVIEGLVKTPKTIQKAFLSLLGNLKHADIKVKRSRENTTWGDVGRDIGANLRDIPLEDFARARMHPILWKKFMAELVSGAAPQIVREPQGLADGPFVILLDISSSMRIRSRNGVSRYDRAAGATLAFLRWAQIHKREARVIAFNFNAQPTQTYAEFLLRPPHVGGDTSIYSALRAAGNFITNTPRFRAADILLMSDGESTYADPRISKHVRVRGVAVVPEVANTLRTWCPDGVWSMDDLERGELVELVAVMTKK